MTKTIKTFNEKFSLKIISPEKGWYKCHVVSGGKEIGTSFFYGSFQEAKRWGLTYVWILSIVDKEEKNGAFKI